MVSNPPTTIQRWKCICAYDGTHFDGWQSQAGGQAVQDIIERRLAQIFGNEIRIHGSGRTDAGVHALEQVFHFDAEWRHGPDKLIAALRTGLPGAIQVKSVRAVPSQFHARFSVKRKRYVYRLHLGDADPFTRPFCWALLKPIDVGLMKSAAAVLRGTHDFRAFTALNGPAREDTVRDLQRLDVLQRGRRIEIVAEANGFLYKMVRSLVGVLVAVGEQRLSVEDVRQILAAKQRVPAVHTAPPQGLFLAKVFYRQR
jgi:tRNA pseudouridine38-40 synthase